jgi:hypothetical protein
MRQILIDSGILLSYCQADETLCLLGDPGNGRVLAAQNHLLQAVASGGILTPALAPADYARIAERNSRYADLPGLPPLSTPAIPEGFSPGVTPAHTAQSSASSSRSPGKSSPPSSTSAGSRRSGCGVSAAGSPGRQISAARCSGNSNQPSRAPLAR